MIVVPLPGVQRHVLGFAAQKVLTQRRPCVGQRGIEGEDLYRQLAVVARNASAALTPAGPLPMTTNPG